jgi:hypothetical protein
MKPRNRDINIFNLSMLDVICGSLGAFILLMVILLPYYKKDNIDYQEEIRQIQQQLASAQLQTQQALTRASAAEAEARSARDRAQTAELTLAQLQQNAGQPTRELEQQLDAARQSTRDAEQRAARAEQMLIKTFLVIYIRWNTPKQDVDMHVVDPVGAEFYYKKKTVSGRPGELSEDSQFGPGNEVWEIKEAPSGQYQIFGNLYARHGNADNPTIKGRIFFRDGSKPLPEIVLTGEQVKKPIGVITVKDDGTVQFNW